jgi:hypothetical protein
MDSEAVGFVWEDSEGRMHRRKSEKESVTEAGEDLLSKSAGRWVDSMHPICDGNAAEKVDQYRRMIQRWPDLMRPGESEKVTLARLLKSEIDTTGTIR